MIEITIIPSVCGETGLEIGSVSAVYREQTDSLKIYGLLTARQNYERYKGFDPDIVADFIDEKGNIVYHQVSTHDGSFDKTNFTTFVIELAETSTTFDIESLSEIRLYPILRNTQ